MIDCHIHLDPELVSPKGLVASMDAFGLEKAALIAPMNPDLVPTFLTRVGPPVFRRGITGKSKLLRKLGRRMYRSWVKKDSQVDVGGKQYPVFRQPDNSLVARALPEYPDRFLGWIFINPRGPVLPAQEIGRWLSTPGFIGVKAHPFWHDTPLESLSEAADLCRENRLAMLIHLGPGKNGDFKLLPERFPGVNFIYAHAGIPYQRAVWEYAVKKKNVYIDLSSPAYVDARIALQALDRAGIDKCLFGSDGPYFHHENGKYDYGPVLSILRSCGLPEPGFNRVARENFLAAINRD